MSIKMLSCSIRNLNKRVSGQNEQKEFAIISAIQVKLKKLSALFHMREITNYIGVLPKTVVF